VLDIQSLVDPHTHPLRCPILLPKAASACCASLHLPLPRARLALSPVAGAAISSLWRRVSARQPSDSARDTINSASKAQAPFLACRTPPGKSCL
jgi:hypothetical protein